MRLPYDEVGEGDALILLHAGVADRTMWREHLDPLAAGHRVIAVDLPGFGEAPAPGSEVAPWDDVLETMDALGVGRGVLVGNSLGGAVALRVALVAPDRVTALALISVPPPDLEPSAELTAAWEAEETALARGGVEAAVQAVLNAWTLPDAPAELLARVADMQRRAFVAQAAAAVVAVAHDPLEREPGRLSEIAVPVLVAAGDREFSDFREGARRIARTLPRATHTEIAGAGHLAPLETPERFRDILLGFLAG